METSSELLEESIDSSPYRLDSSIRQKREHRKTKRRRLNELHQGVKTKNEGIHQMYYDESEQEEIVRPVEGVNRFKRFQAENMMVAADTISMSFQEKKVPGLTQKLQEFQTCERLIETQLEQDAVFLTCKSSVENQSGNFESVSISDGLEDDILLKACQENCPMDQTLVPDNCDRTMIEAMDKSEHNVDVIFTDWSPTPHPRGKTIVETILEDFCSSPISSESECTDPKPEDTIPFFRFRRKKIRTYERGWRRNSLKEKICETTLIELNDRDDNNDSDTSSELSVQEDLSQVLPSVEPFDHLNSSTRIRNNLFNLSAFFTQNILDNLDAENTDENRLSASENDFDSFTVATHVSGYDAIKLLIMEILTLRAKYSVSNDLVRAHCNEDFHGFCFGDESEKKNSDRSAEHHQRNILCSDSPTLMKVDDLSVDLSTLGQLPDHADQSSHQTSFDEDSWHHDSDFFANFQTQAVLQISNPEETKTRRKSESSLQLPKPKIMKEQINENKSHTKCNDISATVGDQKDPVTQTQISIENVLKLFEPSGSASNNNLEVSMVEECDFDCMLLSEWPLEDRPAEKKKETQKGFNFDMKNCLEKQTGILQYRKTPEGTTKEFQKSPIDVKNECLIKRCQNVNGEKSFSGFQTASRKVIHISEEAKRKTTNIFEQLPDIPSKGETDKEKKGMILNTKSDVNKKSHEKDKNTIELEVSQQLINKSEEIQEKSKKFLPQSSCFPDKVANNKKLASENPSGTERGIAEELADFFKEDCISEVGTGSSLVGFQTASGKAIIISKDTEERVKSIFAQLPDFPKDDLNQSDGAKMEGLSKWTNEAQNYEVATTETFTGFQTASRKAINISEDTKNKVTNIFAQLPELPLEKTNKTTVNKESCTGTFTGFQTASRKAINISEEARKKITSVFAQLPELPDGKIEKPDHYSNCYQVPIQKKEHFLNQGVKATESFTGWVTTSRKAFNVSDDAKNNVRNIISQLSDLPREIKPNKSKAENFEDLSNLPSNESKPSCVSLEPKEFNPLRKQTEISNKRKLQTDDKTPKREQPHKILCRSHTWNENSTNSSDNIKRNDESNINLSQGQNSKLIGRKNLLSLTKRRRESLLSTGSVKVDCSDEFVDTPVKTLSVACESRNTTAPNTPQGNDFHSHFPKASSTPQQFGTAKISNKDIKPAADNLDSDFKCINWENTDDSNNENKILNVTPTRMNGSVLNNSLKPQPSPQERIENLSSCGDPPPLPQLVGSSNRSRSLGMSRRRRICTIKK